MDFFINETEADETFWISRNIDQLADLTVSKELKWKMYGSAGTAYITTADIKYGDLQITCDVIVHFIQPNGQERTDKLAIMFGFGRNMVNRDENNQSNQYSYERFLQLNTIASDTVTYQKLCFLYDAVYLRVMELELRKMMEPVDAPAPINNE